MSSQGRLWPAADTVAWQPPPAVPASHVDPGSSLSYSSSHPPASGKTVEVARGLEVAPGLSLARLQPLRPFGEWTSKGKTHLSLINHEITQHIQPARHDAGGTAAHRAVGSPGTHGQAQVNQGRRCQTQDPYPPRTCSPVQRHPLSTQALGGMCRGSRPG